jgi:hypothetical protein
MPLGKVAADICYAPYNELPATWRTCLDLGQEAHRSGSLPIAAVVIDGQGNVIERTLVLSEHNGLEREDSTRPIEVC